MALAFLVLVGGLHFLAEAQGIPLLVDAIGSVGTGLVFLFGHPGRGVRAGDGERGFFGPLAVGAGLIRRSGSVVGILAKGGFMR